MSAVIAKIDAKNGKKSVKTQSTVISKRIADYKRSASDTILEATENCILQVKEKVGVADATKFCQQIHSQRTSTRWHSHISIFKNECK